MKPHKHAMFWGFSSAKLLTGYFVSSASNNQKLVVNYDQPLTQHPTNNPHPSICAGIEITTSNQAFQVFEGNCNSILPQNNNMFHQNDFTKEQILIGINITRLWKF